jgi:hypothetical protein
MQVKRTLQLPYVPGGDGGKNRGGILELDDLRLISAAELHPRRELCSLMLSTVTILSKIVVCKLTASRSSLSSSRIDRSSFETAVKVTKE